MSPSSSERVALLQELMQQRRKSTATYMKYLSRIREYAPGERLYMREVHMIMFIGPQGSATMASLAEKMEVTQGAVSQIAARLEAKGYIRREPCADNRRITAAYLTEKGRDMYQKHQEYDFKQYARVSPYFECFSEEELRLFEKYEQVLSQVLEKANREE